MRSVLIAIVLALFTSSADAGPFGVFRRGGNCADGSCSQAAVTYEKQAPPLQYEKQAPIQSEKQVPIQAERPVAARTKQVTARAVQVVAVPVQRVREWNQNRPRLFGRR